MKIILHQRHTMNNQTLDWKIDDGSAHDGIIDEIKFIVIETQEEHDKLHELFDNLPKCKGMAGENIRYYGDMAKFIMSNL